LGSHELSKEYISKLKEFATAGRHRPDSILFGGIDEEILGCIPGHAGARVVNSVTVGVVLRYAEGLTRRSSFGQSRF
jgi:hypothetical protein